MRVYGKPSQGPSWATALLIFVALLVALQFFRTPTNQGLEEQFAARPPAPGAGQLALPPLPSAVADLARTAIERLRGGERGPVLTPVASSASLRVEIDAIEPVSGGYRVTGAATNTGTRSMALSLSAFRFTDAAGTLYVAEGAPETRLRVGQSVPLDMTLPIADPGQLILEVEVDGEEPLRMILLQSPADGS
jgi:hypothetical protein